MPSFGGCLHGLSWSRWMASLMVLRLLQCDSSSSPPPGPWAQRRLKLLYIFYLERSPCIYVLLSALHVRVCRFLNVSKRLARFLRCQRPLFSSVVMSNNDRSPSRQPMQSFLLLPSQVPLSPVRFPKHHSFGWPLVTPMSRTPREKYPPLSHHRLDILTDCQSWRGRLRMKACGSRRKVLSSIRCSGGATGGKLPAVRRNGPRWGSA